jgi:uncharacterized protein
MRKVLLAKCVLVVAVLCVGAAASAADSKPSDESLRRLLAATEAHKLLDAVTAQMEGTMKGFMRQAFEGKDLSAEQQRSVDGIQTKMAAAVREQMTWETLEPMYLRIYRDSFTQEEVDGMIAFYESPAGRAVVRKLPLVMQNTMAEMQKLMRPVMEKLTKAAQKEAAQVRSISSPKD